MKKVIIIITCVVVTLVFSTSNVDAKTKYNNLPKAKAYCSKYYKDYKIKVVKMNKIPKNRKSKKVIYIEKVYTKSLGGKNGVIVGTKCKIKYTKKVKKGIKQYCYFVYNPNNNACDDIIAYTNCNVIECDIPTTSNKQTTKAESQKKAEEPTQAEEPTTINCPCCDGNNHDCVYWVHNENRHMSEEEIADFEYWEGHYIDEEGNVCEF